MLDPQEKEQLDRMEKLVVEVHAKVNQHHGFIEAFKWLMGGIAAGATALLTKLGLSVWLLSIPS